MAWPAVPQHLSRRQIGTSSEHSPIERVDTVDLVRLLGERQDVASILTELL